MRMWEIREGDYYKDDYRYGKKHSDVRGHGEEKTYEEGFEEGYEEGYFKAMKDAKAYESREPYRMSR